MSPLQENYRHLGETMIKKFASRNIDAYYVDTAEEAKQKVLELMPEGSSAQGTNTRIRNTSSG